MTLLGYVFSFFGQISHDTIIVAPPLCSLNLLKLWYLLLFSKRKIQKKIQKKAGDLKILLANISTMGSLHSMIETDLGSCSAGLPSQSAEDFIEALKIHQNSAKDAIALAQDRQAKAYDKKR